MPIRIMICLYSAPATLVDRAGYCMCYVGIMNGVALEVRLPFFEYPFLGYIPAFPPIQYQRSPDVLTSNIIRGHKKQAMHVIQLCTVYDLTMINYH